MTVDAINHKPRSPKRRPSPTLRPTAAKVDKRSCRWENCNFCEQLGQTNGTPGFISLFARMPPQNGHLSLGHFISGAPITFVNRVVSRLCNPTDAEESTAQWSSPLKSPSRRVGFARSPVDDNAVFQDLDERYLSFSCSRSIIGLTSYHTSVAHSSKRSRIRSPAITCQRRLKSPPAVSFSNAMAIVLRSTLRVRPTSVASASGRAWTQHLTTIESGNSS